jgi:hypothetical protein
MAIAETYVLQQLNEYARFLIKITNELNKTSYNTITIYIYTCTYIEDGKYTEKMVQGYRFRPDTPVIIRLREQKPAV